MGPVIWQDPFFVYRRELCVIKAVLKINRRLVLSEAEIGVENAEKRGVLQREGIGPALRLGPELELLADY